MSPLARRAGAPHERGAGGGSDPPFLAAGAPPGRVKGDTQNDTFTLPLKGGRSLHSDPCGKAIEPKREPVSMTLPGTAATAGKLTIGAVSSRNTSACMYPFAEQVIGQSLCRTKYDILNQPIDARRSIEAWRIHYNRVRPHSGLGFIRREQFRLAGKDRLWKRRPLRNLGKFSEFPPFPQPRRRRESGRTVNITWMRPQGGSGSFYLLGP